MSVFQSILVPRFQKLRTYLTDPWKRAYIFWMIKYPFTKRYTRMQVTLPDDSVFDISDFASFFSTYKSIFVDKIYDFTSPVEDPKIVICGENIGLSVLFFKRLYPKAKVIAFEADPEIFKILKRNITRAHLKNVTIYQQAVWYKNTTLTFAQDHADGGRIDAQLESRESTKVKAVNFNEFLKKNKDIIFLNMDIEGAESTVLEACLPQMKKIPFLFIEYHSFVSRKQSLGSILHFLEDNNFRIHIHPEMTSLSPFRSVTTRGGMDMQVNVFASKDTGILDRSV